MPYFVPKVKYNNKKILLIYIYIMIYNNFDDVNCYYFYYDSRSSLFTYFGHSNMLVLRADNPLIAKVLSLDRVKSYMIWQTM